MAVQGPFKVEFEDVFPSGAGVRRVAPKRDFNASSKDNPVQAKDKDTGLPLWLVTVIDKDTEAIIGEVRVNIAASHQPVPPAKPDGADFPPVELLGLRVMPYVDAKGRLAYSLRADAMQAPGANRQGPGRKEAA